MRRFTVAAAFLLAAVAAHADEPGYKFRISYDKAGLVFTDAEGTRWTKSNYACGSGFCEVSINAYGDPKQPFDLNFKRIDARTIRTRCLRERCELKITTDQNRVTTKSLKQRESVFVPAGSLIEISASPATPPSSSQNR